MRRARWLVVLFLVGLAATVVAGDVQILCEQGLKVFLDDTHVGTSSAKEDGLFLMDVSPGKHTIRVEKSGFLPQSFAVEVLDQPLQVEVGEFRPIPLVAGGSSSGPELPPPVEVKQRVGRLVVTSAPQNCVVELDGRAVTKTDPELELGRVDAGEHTITFFKQGYERLSATIAVEPDAHLRVRGNLIEGAVEVEHVGKGALRLITTPDHCTVRFHDKLLEKTQPILNLTHLPAGEHLLVVSWGGRDLRRSITIKNGQRAIVRVSFMEDSVPFQVSYEPEKTSRW